MEKKETTAPGGNPCHAQGEHEKLYTMNLKASRYEATSLTTVLPFYVFMTYFSQVMTTAYVKTHFIFNSLLVLTRYRIGIKEINFLFKYMP